MIKVHMCISGFTQTEARRHGVFKLKERLIKETKSQRVMLREWNDDWKKVAEHMWLLGQSDNIEIQVYGYSWGGGWGAMQFAKYLRLRGIKIKTMVLCDAVYRHGWVALRAKSMFPRKYVKIKVPDNVEEVFAFHQTQNRPQGHVIVAQDDQKTLVHDSVELHYSHQFIDDSKEWHDKVLEMAMIFERPNNT